MIDSIICLIQLVVCTFIIVLCFHFRKVNTDLRDEIITIKGQIDALIGVCKHLLSKTKDDPSVLEDDFNKF